MKKCKKCNIDKNLEEFYVHKCHKDGKSSHCKECIKKYSNNQEFREKKRMYRNRPEIKFDLNKKRLKRCHDNLTSWIGHIPLESKCEICDIKIYFSKKNPTNALCFDHKSNDCTIKGAPYDWLIRNRFSEKNKSKFDSCNFGKICRRCNYRLPTNSRVEWLKSITNYILGER